MADATSGGPEINSEMRGGSIPSQLQQMLPLSLLTTGICSVLREAFALVAGTLRGRRASDVISIV